jgi:hypothetical protein
VHGCNNGPADIIHVENWRESVQAGGVKLIAVHHGDVGKGFKVSLHNKNENDST